MAKGRAVAIVLEAAEKIELTALTRKHGAPQALAERARIVLAAAAGSTTRRSRPRWVSVPQRPAHGAIASRRAGWMVSTTSRALVRRARSATMKSPPRSARRWTRFRKAQHTGACGPWAMEIGHAPSTVHRIWSAFGLQPHRVETFKLSSDPLFVEKVRSPSARAGTCTSRRHQPHGSTKSNGSSRY